jgi:hypothetical protein
MMRRLFATAFVVVAMISGGGPAFAAPAQTETTTQQNLVETFQDVVPSCDDGSTPTHSITTTSNLVEHSTLLDGGGAHFTFTQTGTFVAEPLNGGPRFTGTFTVWGGFNDNGKVENGTFTFTIRGTGSDGSRFVTHSTDHFNTTPTGAEFFFTRCHD